MLLSTRLLFLLLQICILIPSAKPAWNFTCKVIKPEYRKGPLITPEPSPFFKPYAGHMSGQSSGRVFRKLRLLYITIGSTSRSNAHALQQAYVSANRKLSEMLGMIPLDELRYPRLPLDTGGCVFPEVCSFTKIPAEYLGGCPNHPDKGVPTQPSQGVLSELAQEMSVVIFVRVDPTATYKLCEVIKAAASMCHWEERTGRPISGTIIFCADPTSYAGQRALLSVLLHETMHILTHNTLLGYNSNKWFPGDNPPAVINIAAFTELRKNRLENNTWEKSILNWWTTSGHTRRITVEVVRTPTVLEAVRAYFRCTDNQLRGAEVSSIAAPTDGSHNIDDGHWSVRLFPEEVLTRMYVGPDVVVSALTLGALKDTGWYEVNMRAAEPMDYDATHSFNRRNTRGRQYDHEVSFCHLATQSCDRILTVAREWLQNDPFTLLWVGPNCDPTGNIPTRACTPDGRYRLHCWRGEELELFECWVYVKKADMDSHSIDCKFPARYSAEEQDMRRGTAYRSTCVTFPVVPRLTSDPAGGQMDNRAKVNYPVCMEFECSRSTWSFNFFIFNADLARRGVPQPCEMRDYCSGKTINDPNRVCLKRDAIAYADQNQYLDKRRNTTLSGRRCFRWDDPRIEDIGNRSLYDDRGGDLCKPTFPPGSNRNERPVRHRTLMSCFTNDRYDLNLPAEAENCFVWCWNHYISTDWYTCQAKMDYKMICPDYRYVCAHENGMGFVKEETRPPSAHRIEPVTEKGSSAVAYGGDRSPAGLTLVFVFARLLSSTIG